MNDKVSIESFFASPVMRVHLDFDLEKLTEFAFQMQNKDKKGVQYTNIGGWHSNDIREEKHEEFIRLNKEINQYLQIYHSEVFREMVFKENVVQDFNNVWVNINEKHHYNDWHIHPNSTISGTYYIKHDGCIENGDILFKHPKDPYMTVCHWPVRLIESYNATTSHLIKITPISNMLLLFPSWLEHKVETNLKNDSRISLSFNTTLILEKKSQ